MGGRMDGLIERIAALGRPGDDGLLLERFVAARDETAFAALLALHGPMVLGVCRRLLRNEADAEDAFQATFLVLARKAASVRPAARVGGWLYGVARRTALHARRAAARRKAKEAEAAAQRQAAGEDVGGLREVLDAELDRLSRKHKEVIVLCDLQDRGRKEVAALLGCAEGTVASRLDRARRSLAERLAARGVRVAVGAPLAGLAADPVPAALARSTAGGCVAFAAREGAGAVPARAVALAEEVLRAMFTNRMTKAALLLLIALLAATAGLASAGKATPPPQQKVAAEQPAAKERDEKPKEAEGLEALQGMWLATDGRDVVWEIAGGKLTESSRRGNVMTGEIKVDPEKRPRTIGLKYDKYEPAVHGIYEIEKNTLRVCLAAVSRPRPAEFKRSTGQSVYSYNKYLGKGEPTRMSEVGRVYQDNEAQADAKFTSKQLMMFGYVKRIRREGAGYALIADSDGDAPPVFSFSKEARDKLAALKTGQLVIIRGRCKGKAKTEWGQEAVVFTGCELVEPKN